jgi:hypothetical protein
MIALEAMIRQNELLFLCSRYENMDFLVAKNQVGNRFLPENEKKIRSAVRFLSSIVRFEGKILPVFDFDSYLRSVFEARAINTQCIFLVSSIGKMGDACREAILGLDLKLGNDYEKIERICVKVPGSSETVTLPKNEMKILPPLMHEVQNTRGILGLRFIDEGKIQYILDMEIILINSIAHRAHSNSHFGFNMR